MLRLSLSIPTANLEYSNAFDDCTEISNSDRTLRMGSSSIVKARRDDGHVLPEDLFIDVFVPPGKVGIIIDTPDNGPPVIHAIKDTSAVRNQICVGDQLIAIEDEDVREMTAIHVSRIISSKIFNPQRKFTIMRSSDVIHII